MKSDNNPNTVTLLLIIALAVLSGCGESSTSNSQGDGHGASSETAQSTAVPDPNVDHALGDDPAFEWMGVYTFPQGALELVLQPGPDESMNIALLPVSAS